MQLQCLGSTAGSQPTRVGRLVGWVPTAFASGGLVRQERQASLATGHTQRVPGNRSTRNATLPDCQVAGLPPLGGLAACTCVETKNPRRAECRGGLVRKRKGLTGNGLVRHPVALTLPAIQWPLPGRAKEGRARFRLSTHQPPGLPSDTARSGPRPSVVHPPIYANDPSSSRMAFPPNASLPEKFPAATLGSTPVPLLFGDVPHRTHSVPSSQTMLRDFVAQRLATLPQHRTFPGRGLSLRRSTADTTLPPTRAISRG